MVTKVNLPKSGMGINEGMVVRWLVAVGDSVEKGQHIADVETAKAIQELEAPVAGSIAKILVAAGESTEVNTALATIHEKTE